MQPVKISGACVRDDAHLQTNVLAAMGRGLPELVMAFESRPPLIVAASGPSLKGELGKLRELREAGASILAIRGAHDFLIENGIIPDYALTVDPLPESWTCFSRKHPEVEYWISAQCDAAVFEHLSDCRVLLWYPFIGHDVPQPAGKLIISGGSTSGLRGISAGYVTGHREFHLFGFDSCLSGAQLRLDGTGLRPEDKVINISIGNPGEIFHTNGAMAHQHVQFETYYDAMPDATFKSYGYGLITATIEKRQRIAAELAAIQPQPWNDRVSFIHRGGPTMASYRYRAEIPARELGASINDLTASTLIFAKPQATELMEMAIAQRKGQHVIVDFCDDHFDWPFYKEALGQAQTVTCNTLEMEKRIKAQGRDATVIPDPYEYPLEAPHCRGWNCLWFGHSVNRESLYRILDDVKEYPLRVVGNFDNAIPWSYATMLREFKAADVVLMPATDTYKSPNRTIEAIRQGCFVIAEPHPAINDFPGIWIGNIKEGLEWLKRQSVMDLSERISTAQKFVTDEYSPKTAASVWRTLIQSPTTSETASADGRDGSVSALEMSPT